MEPSPAVAQRPLLEYLRPDPPLLRENMHVAEAIETLRLRPFGQTLIYFYVVNEERQLVGVLQTRRLLAAQPGERLAEIMIRHVIAVPQTATVLDVCELFVMHKYLAFPVVDGQRRVLGTVDINLFNEEIFGQPKAERVDDVFQTIGLHIAEVKNASPLRVFRFRFPWLLVTIGAGTACAFLARLHAVTLAQSLFIAFFLTLVLALNEAVTVQSMALVIDSLHARQPSRRWYLGALRRELLTALPLAAACAAIVALVVAALGGGWWTAAVIGGSIAFTLLIACLLGLSLPTLLHAAKLDVKIAAGPITLALTDVATLLVYFTLASWLLG